MMKNADLPWYVNPLIHPHTVVQGGVMKKECSELMKNFFAGKR